MLHVKSVDGQTQCQTAVSEHTRKQNNSFYFENIQILNRVRKGLKGKIKENVYILDYENSINKSKELKLVSKAFDILI